MFVWRVFMPTIVAASLAIDDSLHVEVATTDQGGAQKND
jgi:hypothetical protein